MPTQDISSSRASAHANLSSIHIYPVKSGAGIALSNANVERQGLSFDRRFMLADKDGKMLTARRFHQLLQLKSALTPQGLVLSFLDQHLTLNYQDFERKPVTCQVWGDSFEALSTHEAANKWVSQIVGQAAQLLYTGEQSARIREKIATNVSFADGYPLLLIGQGSLDLLNQKSPETHQMAQFRPNLVIDGIAPFAEDGWKRIRIGEVEFELAKPCIRCVLTTVNPQTSMKSERNEPIRTLLDFRADAEANIYFGQNLIAKNEGVIYAGDKVEILETQTAPVYPGYQQASVSDDAQSSAPVSEPQKSTPPVQTFQIEVDGQTFEGDNQSALLEQAEKAGISIKNSCRAGLCGACKVSLISGNVEHADVPALSEVDKVQGRVLACSCVPQSKLKISTQKS